MKLKVEYIPTEKLKPYSNNAKIHTAEQIEQIKKSIQEFGMNDPIAIWKNNEIIEGHGRLIACSELGIEQVPVIRLDDLTDEQRRAYMLVHNQLTMNTGFDLDVLNLELEDIDGIDMSDFGFNLEDEEGTGDIVEVEIPEDVSLRCKNGDVWALGDHRLMCGDATSIEQMSVLMDGDAAKLVVTDPPYNMAYEGAGNTQDRASKRMMNDNMPEESFYKFLVGAYSTYRDCMEDGATIYIFYKELGRGNFINAMAESGLTFKQELVWVKSQLVLGGSKYQSMYEPCLMGCKGKSIKTWHGGRKQKSVIEDVDLMGEDELREAVKELMESIDADVIREKKNTVNDLHPTMKPVKLNALFIKNSSSKGDIVIDFFGGSGSTMMACEQLGRKCYMAELDPKYCDVIVQRWENFTGKKAVLIQEAKS